MNLIGLIIRYFQWFLELFAIPDIRYRWILVGLAVANAIVSIILEDFVTEIGLQKFWNKYDDSFKNIIVFVFLKIYTNFKEKTSYFQIWIQENLQV